MKRIFIVLFLSLVLVLQFSCKKEVIEKPTDTPTLLAVGGRSPSWAPDGKVIAYIYEDNLYLMKSDGSNKRMLESDIYDYPVIWSPSGNYMIYLGFSSRFELFRIDANGENKTSLSGPSTLPNNASWSPDGQKIAFTSWDGDLSVMNLDGSNLQNLVADVNTYQTPSWSPDMTRLLFTNGFDNDRDIYFINTDGSNPIRLSIESVYEEDVQFSVDGAKVFFKGGGDIYSANLNGSGMMNLTGGQGPTDSFKLSPDGTKIAFSSYMDNITSLYIMTSDGTSQQKLVEPVAGYMGISWSPDGKNIAFYYDKDKESGIYFIQAPY